MAQKPTTPTFIPSVPKPTPLSSPSAHTPGQTPAQAHLSTFSTQATIVARPALQPPTDPTPLPVAQHSLLRIPPLAPAPSVARPSGTIVVWYRSDLRLHDHPALTHAIEEAGPNGRILPVYVFDPRAFGKTPFGFEKTGRYRAKFLIESVTALRNALRDRASDLVVRIGYPEKVLPELCRRTGASALLCHKEVSLEDKRIEQALHKALEKIDVQYEPLWANTLYHVDDLPFPLEEIPDVYTHFREAVQKRTTIRDPLPAPDELQKTPRMDAGRVPTLRDLGLTEPTANAYGMHNFTGGEKEALSRLDMFVTESRHAPAGRSSAVHLGTDFSCRISPWLSLGCVSPRKIYADLSSKAGKAGQTTTYFELIWRDFFKYISAKYNTAKVSRAGSGEQVAKSSMEIA